MIKKLIKTFLLFSLLSVSFSQLYIESSLPASQRPTVLPIGGKDIVIYRFVVSGNASDQWKTMVFGNLNPSTLSQWFKFKICEDLDDNGFLSDSEKNSIKNEVDATIYGTSAITINTLSEHISPSAAYFIVVDVATTANDGAIVQLTPNAFYDNLEVAAILSSNVVGYTYKLAKLYTSIALGVTTNYFPADSEIDLFNVQLRLSEDSRCLVTFDLDINYPNAGEGIGEIRIYRDGYSSPLVTAEVMASDSFLLALPYADNNLVKTTTKNFYIRYYNDSYGDTGISFNIKINGITGADLTNGAKGYPYSMLEEYNTMNVKISGLYPTVTSIFPADNTVAGGEISVFSIHANSYYVGSTLNTIELIANGDFGFNNIASDDVILNVFVYTDKGTIGAYDALDIKIATYSVGYYDIIDIDTIRITIDQSISNFFTAGSSLNLIIRYELPTNIQETSLLRTMITNMTYTSAEGGVRSLETLFENDNYNDLYTAKAGIVSMAGSFITKDVDIIFPKGGGKKQIAYFDFSYIGSLSVTSYNPVYVEDFIFKNNGSLPINFLEFSLISDANSNKILDSTDLPIVGEEVLIHHYDTVNNIVTFNYPHIQLLLNDANKGYFLMLNIPSSSDAGKDIINLELIDVLYYERHISPDSVQSVYLTENYSDETKISISVSTLLMKQDKFTSFAIPYRKDKTYNLATFSITSVEELCNTVNFVLDMQSVFAQEIGTINIKKSYIGDPNNKEFNLVTFNFLKGQKQITDTLSYTSYDHLGITRQYRVIFDPNENVNAGITLDLVIKNIVGKGDISKYDMNCFSEDITINLGLSGLKVTLDSAIVSGTYAEMMDIPIFRVDYQSFFDNITLNGINLNVATLNNFTFTSSGGNRVKEVSVYRDNNDNKIWDNNDSLLFLYTIGADKVNELYLTLNQLAISANSNSVLFIVYNLFNGSTIANQISVRNYIDKFYYTHSLDTQVITVNKSYFQDIMLSAVNYFFTPGSDLFSTLNYDGAYDVPILSFGLKSTDRNNLTSYNIFLETNKNLYSNNDSGIRSVMLIEDVDNNNTYSSSDVIMSVVNDFSNTSTRVTLNIRNVSFISKNYVILYSFGQKISNLSNIAEERLKPKVYAVEPTTLNKTAGLFPYPRNTRYMSFVSQGLNVELLSITPNNWTTGDLKIQLRLTNGNAAQITVNSLYPQFYEGSESRLNVTYLYNISSTMNFPVTFNAGEQKDISFTISTDTEFKRDNLLIDAFVDYNYDGQSIRVQRRDLLSGWEKVLTTDKSLNVDITEKAIFYLDYPNYIERIIRSKSGLAFLNGDIIDNEYLIFHIKDSIANLDISKIKIILDGVALNMYSTEPSYRYDSQSNSIKVGDNFGKGDHSLKLTLYDNAGNMYPEANIAFSVYDSEQFYIKDFLVYPSKKSQNSFSASPLKIGFKLSKSCEVRLYLFNSRGENVWTDSYDASLKDNYYQLRDFNGILDNGTLIPQGMYILKAIIIENGKKIDAKTTTKFIIN